MNLKFDVLQKVRPIVRYDNMRLLFDTGASTPVWCQSVNAFMEFFPKAKKKDYRFLLSEEAR